MLKQTFARMQQEWDNGEIDIHSTSASLLLAVELAKWDSMYLIIQKMIHRPTDFSLQMLRQFPSVAHTDLDRIRKKLFLP